MVTTTYPGIYIEEIPAGARSIAGVGTSATAFVGRALRGPVDTPVTIHSFNEYGRIFGGLWYDSTLSYAVRHYFQNGGNDAIIVRVHNAAVAAKVVLDVPGLVDLVLTAVDPGAWTNRITARVSHQDLAVPADTKLFHLTVRERAAASASAAVVREEVHYNVSSDAASPRYVVNVLKAESRIVNVYAGGGVPALRPDETPGDDVVADGTGSDGQVIHDGSIMGNQSARTGMYALESVDIFNMLCIPPLQRGSTAGAYFDVYADTWNYAAAYCASRRAILIVDPHNGWKSAADVAANLDAYNVRSGNAILYFPQMRAPDPLRDGQVDRFAACGAIAGVIARTDGERGIWKAPAGLNAGLRGLEGPAVALTQDELGLLNPLGVNAIRLLPDGASVVWGSRTLLGADRLLSEWKYLPVRRMALHIEESLYRGTQWAVFEPNGAALWAQIRASVGAFMHELFLKGAFQGARPAEAYFVECDAETTTQQDVGKGRVNIVVGFAPLKPAEFVVVRIQQTSGTITA